MFKAFFRYFFLYLVRAKTRQRLLFLALIGLALSSFSLLVLQSTMGGFQQNLMGRSKSIFGQGEIVFTRSISQKKAEKLAEKLNARGISHTYEYQLELLIRRSNYIAPAIVHGVSENNPPSFLKGVNFDEMVLGGDLFHKIDAVMSEPLTLVSPAHVDPFFGDIPRSLTVYLSDTIRTNVPEVDLYHAWVKLKKMQNLIREQNINRFRLTDTFKKSEVNDIVADVFPNRTYKTQTWEESHQTLVWALSLETGVITFLFSAMTVLVSLCIVSGLLLFFDKVKVDFASFWVLGASKRELTRSVYLFFTIASVASVLLGLFLGWGLLTFLTATEWQVLPSVFVDRNIPVDITTKGLLISTCIPLGIGLIFILLTLKSFKKTHSYLEVVRSVSS